MRIDYKSDSSSVAFTSIITEFLSTFQDLALSMSAWLGTPWTWRCSAAPAGSWRNQEMTTPGGYFYVRAGLWIRIRMEPEGKNLRKKLKKSNCPGFSYFWAIFFVFLSFSTLKNSRNRIRKKISADPPPCFTYVEQFVFINFFLQRAWRKRQVIRVRIRTYPH